MDARRDPSGGHRGPLLAIVAMIASLLASGVDAVGIASAATPRQVLVIYENNRLLPANVEADRGLTEAIASVHPTVDMRAEFLDYPAFGGDDYLRTVTTYLRDKYRLLKPDVVVVGGTGALDFILKKRSDLFPNVPVVFMGIDKDFVESLKLPGEFYGIPVSYDAVETITQALNWHKQVSRLVVITGLSPEDDGWLARLRRELPRFQEDGRLTSIDYWSGLATAELKTRVASLSRDTMIFTVGYYKDGAGQSFAPRQAAAEIASAASVPVYGPYNTFVGTGVVGGRVPTFLMMGQMAGGIVDQLLSGRPVQKSELPAVMPTRLSVDWRQIERWGIDERSVPADALVQFKALGFWDQYRLPALIALGVVLLQSILVTGLLIERRRRQKAENAVDKHRFELAHAARLAVAGELTASIAHEINQPLGAIQSNVAAAALILDKGAAKDELHQILEDIRRDNLRASNVIVQLRKLFDKHEVERLVVDLGDALADIQIVLRAEAVRRGVELTVTDRSPEARVLGDRVQMQQVLINLVMNAMDAVAGQPDGRRRVNVVHSRIDDSAWIEVTDTGHGIADDHLTKLFDSFFSTKPSGIGLGLSIVRTLVEAHGGTVTAQNRRSGGASFRVAFPVVAMSSKLEVA